jgi:uncharacterized protein
MNLRFSLGYFSTYTAGMLALYWVVLLIAFWIRSRIDIDRLPQWLTRGKGPAGYVLAALAGAATPFCSCTTVPFFVGMLESDVRLGCAVSFLIASPLIHPPAVVLMAALFGLRDTVLYVAMCLAVAMLGGSLLSAGSLRKHLVEFLMIPEERPAFSLKAATLGFFRFLPSLLPALLLSGAMAALLKDWIPSEAFLDAAQRIRWAAIPIAVLSGGLLHADIGMLLPIGRMFVTKGFDRGIAFAFMMAASGSGIPSIILLSRVFRLKLLLAYLFCLGTLIVAAGYFTTVVDGMLGAR